VIAWAVVELVATAPPTSAPVPWSGEWVSDGSYLVAGVVCALVVVVFSWLRAPGRRSDSVEGG